MTDHRKLLQPTDNLLLFGLTGTGKTSQLAEIIKHETTASGKKALVYTTDWGGQQPLMDLAAKGLVEMERYQFPGDPHLFVDSAVQGKRWVSGKWVKDDLGKFCLVAQESLTSMGDLCLNNLGHQVADGRNAGGDAQKAPSLAIQADGYVIKLASNSPTHYGMVQKYLLEKVWQSQSLGLPVVWTAHEDVAIPAKRDDAGVLRPEVAVDIGVQGMIGPLIAGHALTMHLAKYFVYTFRLKMEVGQQGNKHVLLTRRHKDGLYEGLGNDRAPLGANLPGRYEPADVVKALKAIRGVK